MSRIYVFGDCRIEPARRELWRAGALVPLPPQTFDFLAYLIERHERAVGRDELVAAVWGKTDISDTLLGQTVLRLRRELGDDAKAQRLLRTIPRFGYRWVAEMTLREDGDGAPPSSVPAADELPAAVPDVATTLPAAPATRRPCRTLPFVLAAAVLLLAALGVYRARNAPPPPLSVGAVPTTAVLPAEVEPSAEWAWTRLGVMDMVAARLRSAGVPSVPSEQVVALLQSPNGAGGVRDAAGASWLIVPRVHRADGGWQVALDAQDGSGGRYAVEAQAPEIDRAARAASDKLLVALGARPAGGERELPNAELVARVDAAVLADDADGARRLIDAASAEQRAAPELRLRLAKLEFRAGKLDAARTRLQQLLDEAPAATAARLRASILNGLGAVEVRAGNAAAAQPHFDAAIALLAQQADAEQLGQAYLGRAATAADQDRFDAALADYARARVAFREANDALALHRVAADEGFLDLARNRPAQALPALRAASEGFRRWGALNEAIFAYIGRIQCELALLDARAAVHDADEAAALAQRVDNADLRESLSLARARALAAVGRTREARAVLEELRGGTADPATAASATGVLALLELDRGDSAAAAALARQTVAALEPRADLSAARADAWYTALRADGADAATLGAFETWAAAQTERRAQALARLARAQFARRAGSAAWRSEFDAARAQVESDGVPAQIALVARGYADALLADGDLAAAEVEIGRVTRWADQDFGCAVLEARLFAALGRDEARQAAVARARALAGERPIPADALAVALPAHAAAVH